MAVKELQTRIALKYDSFANWADETKEGLGAKLVLLKGELGICEIKTANADSNVAPTVLFKVGDGTTIFKELPWASAKAADVYSWAKASDVELDQDKKQIIFRGGGDVVNGVRGDKVLTFNYATTADAESLAARLTLVENSLGLGGGEDGGDSVATMLADFTNRLVIIEGEGEGSVKKALADAQDYTDEREVEIKKYADQAEADAKSYSDGKLSEAVGALNAKDAELSSAINTKTTIAEVETKIEAYGYATTGEVATAKQEAISAAASTAQEKVNALANGQVETNRAAIAELGTAVANEKTARENADKSLDERLERVEAFFEGAAKDEGEGENLKNALDTLVEIQTYLTGDGSAAGDILTAISNLNDIVKDGGTLEVRVDDVEAKARDNASAITTLQNLTSGYTDEKAIYNAVEGVRELAQTGVDKAATAQGDIDGLKGVVGDTNSGLVKRVTDVESTANTAAADLAALTGTNGRIATIEGIVNSSEGKTIRDDVNALQTLTDDSVKGNDALYKSLTDLTGAVTNDTTGLKATYDIASQNKKDIEAVSGRVTAIESDYLRAADEFIFQCGTSSTVTHDVNAN
jgi:hypothetical protein